MREKKWCEKELKELSPAKTTNHLLESLQIKLKNKWCFVWEKNCDFDYIVRVGLIFRELFSIVVEKHRLVVQLNTFLYH